MMLRLAIAKRRHLPPFLEPCGVWRHSTETTILGRRREEWA
jgi:hypothetical protein